MYCVCTALSREALSVLCVCTALSREALSVFCVRTALSREALSLLRVCTALSREALSVLHVCTALSREALILIVPKNYMFVHLLDNKVFLIVTGADMKIYLFIYVMMLSIPCIFRTAFIPSIFQPNAYIK